MKPYYSDDDVRIFHGDCCEIVPELGRFDLLLTDPPYGINESANLRANKQWGNAVAPSRDYGAGDWDKAPPAREVLEMCLKCAQWSVLWGANHFDGLPPRRGWLVWDKDNGKNPFADCELAWTNFDIAVRKFRYRWMGMLQEPGVEKEVRSHPTQKPLELMKWCIDLAPVGQTILDPFAGSGTTGRAAKDMNRKAVLIEREERYCEIAAERMGQLVFPLGI